MVYLNDVDLKMVQFFLNMPGKNFEDKRKNFQMITKRIKKM